MEEFQIRLPHGTRALVKALQAVAKQDLTEDEIWLGALSSYAEQWLLADQHLPSDEAFVRERLHRMITASSAGRSSGEIEEPQTVGQLYTEFWRQLCEKVNASLVAEGHHFRIKKRKYPQRNWLDTPLKPGVDLNWSFGRNQIMRVELYIQHPKGAMQNKRIFATLEARRAQVEAELGELSWEPLESRASCRIAMVRLNATVAATQDWPALLDWASEAYLRMRSVWVKMLEDGEVAALLEGRSA